MTKYIELEALKNRFAKRLDWLKKDIHDEYSLGLHDGCEYDTKLIDEIPTADVAPVRHGRWILEAHDERVNYRWNVTAECSECCDEQKEIWAGFFPNVPPTIARDVALVSAESVKLSNYCPNCGAKMDGGDGNSDIA